ncbi:MAG: RidA family protein [Chloroflexi bacterium]|nr:RidA family protein [Chloroflexota bacterium]
MPKEIIRPKDVHEPRGYSHAVKAGQYVFVAGQVALDEKGNLVGKDNFASQAEQAFRNLDRVLAAAGATKGDVIKINVYIISQSDLWQYRGIITKQFPANPPSSTLAVIPSLAMREFLIEVEAIAYLGQ